MRKVFDLRANIAIVVVGVTLIIALTKAFALMMPAQYYFAFSQILSQEGDPPLIVEQPSITLARLCDIMKRNNLPAQALGDKQVHCNLGGPLQGLTREQKDKIYTTLLRADGAMRAAFSDALQSLRLQSVGEAGVSEVAEGQENLSKAVDDLRAKYDDQVRTAVAEKVTGKMRELYGTLVSEAPGVGGSLSANDVKILSSVDAALPQEITGVALAKAVPEIRKSAIDDMIARFEEQQADVTDEITNFYLGGPSKLIEETARRILVRVGAWGDREQVQRQLFSEVSRFSWPNYVIGILLRLTPVLLVGFVLGLLVGRREAFSIALAGGLAAFLLSWPMILMWDNVVAPKWHDKELWFLALYVNYAVAFFFTARAAALLGARVQEMRSIDVAILRGPASRAVAWREIAINGGAALLLTVLAYTWNFLIPLAAAAVP
jgi:hypothetical protein